MKILMINSVCGIRSTGRICTDLADILIEKGHDVKIAYGREAVPEKYQKISYRIGSDFDVKVNALKARIFDNEGFNAKRETKKLLSFIEEYKPDIIHLHNLHGYYVNIEILLSYIVQQSIPVIYTMHDCWAVTGHCSHFSEIGCSKWIDGCFRCPQRGEYPTSKICDQSKKNWGKKQYLFRQLKKLVIVTPSEWLASIIKKSYIGDHNIAVIPNGIDLDVFKRTKSEFRKKYNLENKHIILGVATAWSESKGLLNFVRLSKVISPQYAIVLVGLSEKQAKTMPSNIIAINKTNNANELAEIYSAADVFLNLSKQETMGLTTVEAMACGTPVIVSNYTAIPEVVDGNSGVVLDNLQEKTILDNIEWVLLQRWDVTRDRALLYKKKKRYNEYVELYESLINNNS